MAMVSHAAFCNFTGHRWHRIQPSAISLGWSEGVTPPAAGVTPPAACSSHCRRSCMVQQGL